MYICTQNINTIKMIYKNSSICSNKNGRKYIKVRNHSFTVHDNM